MGEIRKTPQAVADLDDIWLYIAQDSISRADQFLDQIEKTVYLLSDNPRMGVARPELMPHLHSFAVGNYIIFYIPLDKGIEVIRVLSGYRKIEALFPPDKP